LWLTRIFDANRHKHTTAVVKIIGNGLSASVRAFVRVHLAAIAAALSPRAPVLLPVGHRSEDAGVAGRHSTARPSGLTARFRRDTARPQIRLNASIAAAT
jgi:hypothetical protein